MCGYNLRGLMGDVVGCPECGQQSDVARLVAAQWTKPWHKAPGLNRVLMPVVVLVLGALTIFIVTGVSDAMYADVPSFWTAMGMWSAVLLLWVVSLVRSARAFDRRGEAVGLSMLAHVICVVFVAAVITLIVCVILMMVQVVDGGFGVQGLINLVLSLVALLLLWLGRKGEKFIAGRCIREHLRRQAKGV